MSDPEPLEYESRIKRTEQEPKPKVPRSSTTAVCPKCNGSMQHGYLLDTRKGPAIQASWVPGVPQPGFLAMKVPKLCPVFAWRCRDCGFLEFYAFDPEEE